MFARHKEDTLYDALMYAWHLYYGAMSGVILTCIAGGPILDYVLSWEPCEEKMLSLLDLGGVAAVTGGYALGMYAGHRFFQSTHDRQSPAIETAPTPPSPQL